MIRFPHFVGLGLGITVLFIAAQSCQDIGTEVPETLNGPANPPDTVSFASEIYPIFSKTQYGCNGCHTGTGSIYWYGSASFTYSNLVNTDATNGPCAGDVRVAPGDADGSVLYKRLAGSTCGDRMPQGGNPISSGDLALIHDWIDQGALNN